MSETEPEHHPKKVGGRINWLLTASLMLNTLLVGLFIGQALSGDRHAPHRAGMRGPPPPAEARIAAGVLESVDPAQRADIRRAFVAALREARPGLIGRRQAQRELRAAMVADPFDPGRLEAAFATLSERDAAMQQAVQAALVEQFGTLSLEQRRSVVEAFEKERRGQGRRRLQDWRERQSGD